VSEADAAAVNLSDGARLITRRGSATVLIEIGPMMRAGHVALPNGLGLTYTPNEPEAAGRYWEMVRHNEERYFASSTRYSTNAFYRRQLGHRFAAAKLGQRIYGSFEEAKSHL
jgi:hypothetical protein